MFESFRQSRGHRGIRVLIVATKSRNVFLLSPSDLSTMCWNDNPDNSAFTHCCLLMELNCDSILAITSACYSRMAPPQDSSSEVLLHETSCLHTGAFRDEIG